MSSIRSEPVVLPSIHEMFPEYLMSPQLRMARGSNHLPSQRSHTFSHPAQPTIQSSIRRHSTASQLRPRASSSSSSSSSKKPARPAPYSYTRPPKPNSSPVFSFDVLRSDPSSSSLEHIASSAILPNRGTGVAYNLHGEASNGSALVFRVSVPSHSRSRSSSTPHLPYAAVMSFPPRSPQPQSSRSDVDMDGDDEPDHDGNDSTNDNDNASYGDLSASRGKKHICPTCAKRFNRPSSLRIHVNTHTGATPFRCPWPNCGRAFNVNSNMRRHYRTHTTSGFLIPHPPTRRMRPRAQTQSQPHSQSRSPKQASAPALPPRPCYDWGSAEEDELEDEDEDGDEEEDDELDEDSGMEIDRREEEGHIRERYPQSHVRGREGEGVYAVSAPYRHSFADTRVSTALRPAFHGPVRRRGQD